MRILMVGHSFLSSYGGPAYSVSHLAQALGAAGIDVGLWAPDGSARTSPILDDKARVRRLEGSIAQAYREFGRPDLVHDNGIWMPHNHAWARLARKEKLARLVSIRGMLEPWARNHKRRKKNLAWWLYQRRDLISARYFHATAETEAVNIQALGLATPILVIPNGVDVPGETAAARLLLKERAPRRAVFLGRFNPKKGLPMLVEAWRRVRPQGWELQLAGFDEAGHRAEIERAVREAGLELEITLHGPVEAEAKHGFLDSAQLFVLPTHSENFGIVVAEALAHGVPVLTTRGAPWAAVEQHNCGWWVAASVDGLEDGLRRATEASAAELQQMGDNGRALIASDYNWPTVAQKFIAAYGKCIETAKSR